MIKLVNRKNQQKCSLVFDEFPTIYFNNMDSLIATARSNKVATTLAVQDFSQLKKDYGAEQSDVITGIIGNVISGQVTGETAKNLSDNFGKIVQDKNSMTINSNDTSTTKATQLDYAIPAAKIAALSSGEFVGIVADNPDQKIRLKVFHSEIQNDHAAIAAEESAYKPIPIIERVTEEDIQENYKRVKREIEELIGTELTLLSAKEILEDDEKKTNAKEAKKEKDEDQKEEDQSQQQAASM
jgi:hypothetical protein